MPPRFPPTCGPALAQANQLSYDFVRRYVKLEDARMSWGDPDVETQKAKKLMECKDPKEWPDDTLAWPDDIKTVPRPPSRQAAPRGRAAVPLLIVFLII